MPARNISLDKL